MFQREGDIRPLLFLNVHSDIRPATSKWASRDVTMAPATAGYTSSSRETEADIETGNTGASWDRWMSHTYDDTTTLPLTPASPEPEWLTSMPVWGQSDVQPRTTHQTPATTDHPAATGSSKVTDSSAAKESVVFNAQESTNPVYKGRKSKKKTKKDLLFGGKKEKKLQSKRLKQLRIHQREQNRRPRNTNAPYTCTCNLMTCRYKRHRTLEDVSEIDEENDDDTLARLVETAAH